MTKDEAAAFPTRILQRAEEYTVEEWLRKASLAVNHKALAEDWFVMGELREAIDNFGYLSIMMAKRKGKK